jgi:hypothetical protein
MFWQQELRQNKTKIKAKDKKRAKQTSKNVIKKLDDTKSTASKETLNFSESSKSDQMEREVLTNIITEVRRGHIKQLYKKYFKSKYARKRFENFLRSGFLDKLEA